MVKTPKKSQKEKEKKQHSPKIIRIRIKRKSKNIRYNNKPITIYNNYISSVSDNKKLNSVTQPNNIDPFIQIKDIVTLLSNYFSKDVLLTPKSLKDLIIISQKGSDTLFAYFGKLLSPDQFYKCFISYIKKSLSNNKIQTIYSSQISSAYYLLFQNLQSKDIKTFLFNNNVSSFIRQDIILYIFDYDKNNVDNFIKMFFANDNYYTRIDKNNLIINESVEDFKNNYLFSNCVLSAIKLTLDKFVNVEKEIIQDTISLLLNKINCFYGQIDESFSAISFLGYNIVIRAYFHDFNNDKIKVSLRNVLTYELIHLLVIEFTDGNLFNKSFEKSNGLVQESGDDYEKYFFGIEVNFYSTELIKYLENFNNFKKNIIDFNKDVINIYVNTCAKEENVILSLSDSECIKKGIVRHRIAINKCKFGHCRKHYMSKNI